MIWKEYRVTRVRKIKAKLATFATFTKFIRVCRFPPLFCLRVSCVVWFNFLGIQCIIHLQVILLIRETQKLQTIKPKQHFQVDWLMQWSAWCCHIIQPRGWMEWSGHLNRWSAMRWNVDAATSHGVFWNASICPSKIWSFLQNSYPFFHASVTLKLWL